MYVLPGHNMPAETLLVFCVSSFWTFWACLVAPRVGWLVAPPGWLVGCTTRLVGWLVAPPGLVNWLVGSLVGWLVGCGVYTSLVWLVGWLVGFDKFGSFGSFGLNVLQTRDAFQTSWFGRLKVWIVDQVDHHALLILVVQQLTLANANFCAQPGTF
jgi:hypothetical protein